MTIEQTPPLCGYCGQHCAWSEFEQKLWAERQAEARVLAKVSPQASTPRG